MCLSLKGRKQVAAHMEIAQLFCGFTPSEDIIQQFYLGTCVCVCVCVCVHDVCVVCVCVCVCVSINCISMYIFCNMQYIHCSLSVVPHKGMM